MVQKQSSPVAGVTDWTASLGGAVVIAALVLLIVGSVQGWLFDAERIGMTALICFGLAMGATTVYSPGSIRDLIRANVAGGLVGGALFVPAALVEVAPLWWFLANLLCLPVLFGFSARRIWLGHYRSGIAFGLSGMWIGITTSIGWLAPWPLWAKLSLAFVFPIYVWHAIGAIQQRRADGEWILGALFWQLVLLGLLVALGWSIATRNWWIVGTAFTAALAISAVGMKEEQKREGREEALLQERGGEVSLRDWRDVDKWNWGPVNPKLVCPHCQAAGQVRTKPIRRKSGISGAKATGAVLTGGLSLLATGLSKKETVTQVHCGNCGMTWYI